MPTVAASLPADQTVSAASASPLIDRGAQALGGAAARAVAARLEADHTGTYFATEQARSPAEPIAAAGRDLRWRFDPADGRLLRDAQQLFPGGVRFSTRTALGPDGGWQVDLIRWRTGTDLARVAADDALEQRLQWERFFPNLLMLQAEAGRTGAEHLGPHRFRYRDAANVAVEVTLDPATGRPLRAAQSGGSAPAIEFEYLQYRPRHGIHLPTRVRMSIGGRVVEDLRLGRTRVGRGLTQASMRPPAGYSTPPAAGQATAREIAPGALFFENMPADYHSMVVDMGDHLVLIEAPLSPAYAEAQRRVLERTRPGKPVRYVLVTHHHGDHTGGLRTWVDAGATVVVARGARVAIERQLRARGFTGELRVEEVEGRRTFGTGAGRLDAYAFQSSHAAAHLLMHLPAHRILFQGDLFYLPARGDPPAAFPVVRDLDRQIAALGLEVDTIAGVHGRPATMAEFRESLRRAR